MTCTHIIQAKARLSNLKNRVETAGSSIYKEEPGGPWVKWNDVYVVIDSGWFSSTSRAKTSSTYKIWNINEDELEKCLDDIKSKLDECNCYATESAKKNELIDAHREERKNMQDRIAGIENNYSKIVDRQHAMIETEKREGAVVRTENSQLQQALGLSKAQADQLEIRLSEKNSELRDSNQALERLRQAFQDLLVSNATYSTEARVVKEQLDWTKDRIVVGDIRVTDLENKLDQRQQQMETLRQSLTTLQITYQTETQDKDNKIKQQESEIKILKDKTGQAQEKFSNERKHSKGGKLEEFATQFGISLQQLDSLRKYYERLIIARKNYNQVNITTHEGNIMTIKQEMLNIGISIANIQKICRKCEKLAEVRFELEGMRQEQYQAHQEQSTNN